MKTLYYTQTGHIVFDDETKVAEPILTSREGISRIFFIKEPMNIVYNKDGKQYTTSADKGDIVVIFYEDKFEHPIVVAKSAEWTENLTKYEELMQKEKEEWAAKKANGNCLKCGDCCEACSPNI